MILKNKKPHYGVKDNGAFKFSVKDVDTVSRTVCAVLNTYNYLDSDMDVLMPGCAAQSIKQRGVDSKSPDKILHALFHDLTRLPGKIKTLDERTVDGKQVLYMESQLTDTVDGNDTLKNYLAGIYNQHSIGFQYTKAGWVERNAHGNSKQFETLMASIMNPADAVGLDAIYRVDEIKLYEGSTVAFGANSMTPMLGMKTENKEAAKFEYLSRIDLFEKVLKSGTQSDEGMYKLELQLRQLKQAFIDIFDGANLKSIKTDKSMTCTNADCSDYMKESMPGENGNCEMCGQEMMEMPKAKKPSIYQKLALEIAK